MRMIVGGHKKWLLSLKVQIRQIGIDCAWVLEVRRTDAIYVRVTWRLYLLRVRMTGVRFDDYLRG